MIAPAAPAALEAVARSALETALGRPPDHLRRMTTGRRNEVYAAEVAGQGLILRLNSDPQPLEGSARHIPVFGALGIPVPAILAADYSKERLPMAWQLQSRLPGRDIGEVIHDLGRRQLEDLASRIAGVFERLATLPPPAWFGWTSRGYATWLDRMTDGVREIAERNRRTGVVGDDLVRLVRRLVDDRREIFANQPPVVHFDDLSSKNVMVEDGVFTGLVDLDDLACGDPLEAVGRIRASWWGTPNGDAYAEAVLSAMSLDAESRRRVDAYAAFNRIAWLSEQGQVSNANTTAAIDAGAVTRDKSIIADMIRRLRLD